MVGDRAHYKVAGATARAFIEDVVRNPDLTVGDLRVAMAVLHFTSTWSKVADRVSQTQLAEVAGVHERTVSRAMRKLEGWGHLTYERSTTKGLPSRIVLNGVTDNDHPNDGFGVTEAPDWGDTASDLGWPLSVRHPRKSSTDEISTAVIECEFCKSTGRYLPDDSNTTEWCPCPVGQQARKRAS